MKDLQAVTTT